jgi:23S rRNA (uracil1939-C5)-methyltransferase
MEPGARLTVRIEKPAAGGRMIARHDGCVLLVGHAIPGEVAEVQVERVQRGTVWAAVTRILEASPDRIAVDDGQAARAPCGGQVFAHIRYARQLELKRDIVRDGFARLARLPLEGPLNIASSAVDGYRMRARFHVMNGRVGFFRDGSHELCDPRGTRQLRDDTLELVERLERALQAMPQAAVSEIALSENMPATERACHLDLRPSGDPSRLAAATALPGLRGVSCSTGHDARALTLWGEPEVTDLLDTTNARGEIVQARLSRHARSFFQGNRFLLSRLAGFVADLVPDGPLIDLYAGVGLFAVTRASRSGVTVMAIEGDRSAAEDLRRNAMPFGGALTVRRHSVEQLPATLRLASTATVIVDPPRTGLSKEATRLVLGWRPPRIVYVSCDVATLARDARTLVDAGYRIERIEAFDLFPNTAHVETVVAFELAGRAGRAGGAGGV